MTTRNVFKVGLIAAIVTTGCGLNQVSAEPDRLNDSQAGVEVLTRGPVHEAFASTISYDPEPGIVVPRLPPALIEELPPEQRPTGSNVEWISGYWSWDDERDDFLWISGLWRSLPPGREWVAGYWRNVDRGAQWTSGYWADATINEREYLPVPPASNESGPNVAQPSPDHIWLPGSWVWQTNRYLWRPGFWAVGQQNWDWVPSQYVWSPRGYTYVNGYWDYPYERRGIMFSPVYFHPNLYRQGGTYSPSVAINLGGFVNNLFLRPSYGHYYFGDYYGSRYSNGGFYPSFSYNSNSYGYGYDPIFAHQRWQNRNDSNWSQKFKSDFQHRNEHDDARPARTWNEQRERISQDRQSDRSSGIAETYAEMIKNKNGQSRFESIDAAERQRMTQRGQAIESSRRERQKVEAEVTSKSQTEPGNHSSPAKVKITRSPLVDHPMKQQDQARPLPERHQIPQPDPEVEPRQRTMRERSGTRGNPETVKPGQIPSRSVPKMELPGKSSEKAKPSIPMVKPTDIRGQKGNQPGTSPPKGPEQPKVKPKQKP